MTFPSLRVLLGIALVASLPGCEPREVPYQVELTVQACAGPSPAEGVTHYQFRISGEGMTPIRVVAVASARRQNIPDIPAGKGRVIEVRGYAGEPGVGGRLVSLGRSLPIDVPSVVPLPGREPGRINVFMRRVNAFTPTSVSVAASTCSRMLSARAGHAAAMMRDGRVLITGGYQLVNGRRISLAKAEIYDPGTGAFSDAPDMGVTNSDAQFIAGPRAFHTATPLPDGRVLLAGGEVTNPDGGAVPLASALVYDPEGRYYGGLGSAAPRSRHAAAADREGRVLLVGGIGEGGAIVERLEWFDPATGRASLIADTLARTGVALAPVQQGALIAAAGGSDGVALSNEVRFYRFDGSTFAPLQGVRLREGRRSAGLAPYGDGSRLVVVGGYNDPGDGATAVAASELISTGEPFRIEDGPAFSARGEVCMATLPDGRVLAVGGRAADEFGTVQSDGSAELLTILSTGAVTVLGMPSVPNPRYQHTCTTLPDGTVLVLGGLQDPGSGPEILQDAHVFTPAPLD